MHNIFITVLCTLLFTFSASAYAQQTASGQTTAQTTSEPRTAVIPDEQAGAIRFVIDGREVARLTDTGFYLQESITYGGALTDTGRKPIDDMVHSIEGERDAP